MADVTPRIMNVTDSKQSRYVNGGETDRFTNRVGWWEKRSIPFADDDMIIIISKENEKRPDLISNEVYGKAMYNWVVLQYNNIVDVEEELVVGREIRMPTYSRLILSIMNKRTGGRRV